MRLFVERDELIVGGTVSVKLVYTLNLRLSLITHLSTPCNISFTRVV